MENKIAPRKHIWCLVKEKDHTELLARSAVLHGHYCPGLALGVNAASEAVRKINKRSSGMEDVIAVVETNNCLTDGVQFVTGCSFGNNSLVFRDLGKTALTLADRYNGKGFRFVPKLDAQEKWNEEFPEYQKLFEKVVKDRVSSEDDRKKFSRLGKEVSHYVVELPVEDLFRIEEVSIEIPDYAPIHESFTCDMAEQGVTFVIAGGMGSRAQSLFQQHRIGVIIGAVESDPEKAVLSYLNGQLATENNICDH
ncbi:MAG: FmdE family protein [Dehalococcoidia bacterium]